MLDEALDLTLTARWAVRANPPSVDRRFRLPRSNSLQNGAESELARSGNEAEMRIARAHG